MSKYSNNTLEEFRDSVLAYGPVRFLLPNGHAIPFTHASFLEKLTCDVIFLRGDGWSLGCARAEEAMARIEWQDEWCGVLRLVEGKWEIQEVKPDRLERNTA